MIFAAAAWAGTCEGTFRSSHLEQRLGEAEEAWSKLDVDRFQLALDDASVRLGCVVDRVGPPLAARYHRLQGLRLFAAREDERAVLAFAAARGADPDFVFPTGLVPSGHVVRDLYARPVSDETRAIPFPREGDLLFDGRSASARPLARPAIVQIVAASGEVRDTAWVWPDDALPAYDASVPLAVASEPPAAAPAHDASVPLAVASERPVAAKARISPVRVALTGTAVACLAGSAVTYALAGSAAREHEAEHPDWGIEELDAQRAKANGLAVGSGIALGVGVGVGVIAWVVPW